MALKIIAASALQAHDPIISVNGTSSKLIGKLQAGLTVLHVLFEWTQ